MYRPSASRNTMPCGRMSMASRSRSWDFRASAIGECASAGGRTISPLHADTRPRPPPAALGLGFAGRPGMRAIPACLSFLDFFGRKLGIATPPRILSVLFCDKGLKKWCRLPAACSVGRFYQKRNLVQIACLRGEYVDTAWLKPLLRIYAVYDLRPVTTQFAGRAETMSRMP